MSDWWSADPVGQASPQGPSATPVNPTQRAFLNAMSAGESPDYNTMYGGGRFEELRDHPRRNIPIRSGPNAGKTSSAAGKYQFLQGTWDEAKNALGLPDFSPESQDRAATWLAERDYKSRTNRDLWKDIEEAKGDPQKLNMIGGALSKTWTSLPGGIEPNRATGGFAQRLAGEFSAQSRQPQAPQGNWWNNDPVAGQPEPQQSPAQAVEARSGSFQAPQNAPALQAGLNQRATQMQNATRGPAADPMVRQSVEMQNQQIAGGQGTTPIMDLQMKNLITDQVFENDAGLAVFRDPSTGQLVEADKNRHVIMRDPQDNRLKVFGRSEATNENPAVSGARVLGQGLAAGAPTARAAIPAANAAVRRGPVPTREQLFEAADEGYTAARGLGVKYNPAAVSEMSFRTQGALIEEGFNEITSPNTYKMLGKLGNAAGDAPAGTAATFNDLESVRKGLRRIAQGHASQDAIVRSDSGAASRAIEQLDEFFANPAGAVAGDAGQLSRIAETARGNFAAGSRSERVGEASYKADLQAASGGSGANIDNAMRQRIKDILKSKKEAAGFSKEELEQMYKIVRGTPAGNTARLLGKLAPTGIVSATMSGGSGLAIGGGVGAVALPLVGFAAKKMSDIMTGSQLTKLDEMVRSRSPLGRQIESALEDWNGKANALADVPNAPKVAQFALATRNLVNNLKDAGISISPSEFMKVLQGPKGAPAEEEQQ